ncbi:putative deoxyribonuclease RhsC [Lysinibacillus sphaericus]|uniref:Putative deoxyribonuclease RhsC n=1 Tax=Lysinibacillus sphaericus TaxID=1421 RepID=A0A2S5CYF1_LYSSH|nr:RHS repeat-associated core domain-containing protein [Lysinibacillus sphaericus]POZ55839.1 putative deoxyribonuclease RhsC [Lysinibacillus sphaericus]
MKEFTGEKEFIPFRYQGQYDDVEIGLYYNRFRYYDPEQGNYTQVDPIGLAGGNPTLYGYVNNPNLYLDIFGLDVTITLIYKDWMPKNEFLRKAQTLQKLGEEGLLYKVAKVSRDRNVTKAFRQDMIKRIWAQYGNSNRAFADKLIDRVAHKMQTDHVWELQLGGPDSKSNLRFLESKTNWDIGTQQIRPQIRNLEAGTKIKVNIKCPS